MSMPKVDPPKFKEKDRLVCIRTRSICIWENGEDLSEDSTSHPIFNKGEMVKILCMDKDELFYKVRTYSTEEADFGTVRTIAVRKCDIEEWSREISKEVASREIPTPQLKVISRDHCPPDCSPKK